MKDKIILITGAGSGIGKALCLSLHHENQLIVIGRDQKKLDEIKSKDKQHIDPYICDIADADQVNLTYQKIASKYGHIDILINNAGMSDARPFSDYDYSKIKKILDINILGTIYFTKVFLPLVLKKVERLQTLVVCLVTLHTPFIAFILHQNLQLRVFQML